MSAREVPPGRCHACGGGDLRRFHEVRGIPVHSTLLFDSAEEARRYPTGDLVLSFCRGCGFIQNQVFDPSVHEYGTRCEESQHFSETFNRFLRGLTADLVERHGLRDKTILEVGCGKGDFLELICEIGNNQGIGIDPGLVPERRTGETAKRLRFIQDFYSDKYADLAGDALCCRHTLEHIQPVRAFVDMFRRAAERRPGALVFFEVPDVRRVLREVAFWDLYYEHCSYFTLGSLGRLFRAAGLAPTNLHACFGDQYLVLEARPAPEAFGSADPAAGHRFPGEESVEETERDVGAFERACRERLAGFRDMIAGHRAAGRRMVVWGSSSKGVSFLTTLGLGDEIGCVVDVNPYRQGKFMPGTGHEIVAPEAMVAFRPDVVLIMNPIYTAEIGAALDRLGVRAELIPA